ncbi:DEBR0S3_01706g1_1 [Brettanomyces bruxellensis]|uniref:Ceramide glucosyltransferase n=1 Tax=Dekkera bruxellensis TaxID=5007 RepID=A0A7D9CXI7_DEKBR|nr:DEBR0S3_01706g1_1 [Brettanomyces bruxellensis]
MGAANKIELNTGDTFVAMKVEQAVGEMANHYAVLPVLGLILYIVVVSIGILGFLEICLRFNGKTRNKIDGKIKDTDLIGVTILRPLKGVDPEMEVCLRSSFEQDYPKNRLEIIFCVQDSDDPAIPIVDDLISKFPDVDAKLMIDKPSEYGFTSSLKDNYGPNPKINNLAKGYKAAKFDTLWVIDSNVWARPDILKRSIYTLTNDMHDGVRVGGTKRVQLINHVPLAVSLDHNSVGADLDEMFLSSSHAKFYVSLNTLSIAPCINGKSNIYRRSDIDGAVKLMGQKAIAPSNNGLSGDNCKDAKYYGQYPGQGIRYFARYIGEDNMIGTALWTYMGGRAGMTTDVVIQPLDGSNTLIDYVNRRVRWLRVRKYMVLAATLVEPTTECIIAGIIGTLSLSLLIWDQYFNFSFFIFHVMVWFCIDYIQYYLLCQCAIVPSHCASDVTLPYFVRGSYRFKGKLPLFNTPIKSFRWFVTIWIIREILAFPIWLIAMMGSVIDWRGQPFQINSDLTVERLYKSTDK